MAKKVTQWITEDGEYFDTEKEALAHEATEVCIFELCKILNTSYKENIRGLVREAPLVLKLIQAYIDATK